LAPARRGRRRARDAGLTALPVPNLETGKYAAYIWPAYAITALVFLGLIAATLAHARRWRERAGGERRKARR
jgi:heme exporter protein D